MFFLIFFFLSYCERFIHAHISFFDLGIFNQNFISNSIHFSNNLVHLNPVYKLNNHVPPFIFFSFLIILFTQLNVTIRKKDLSLLSFNVHKCHKLLTFLFSFIEPIKWFLKNVMASLFKFTCNKSEWEQSTINVVQMTCVLYYSLPKGYKNYCVRKRWKFKSLFMEKYWHLPWLCLMSS